MWKLSRGRVLLDEPPEEEDGLPELPPPALAAAPAQEGSETGWLALETPLEETKAPTLETVLCPRAYRKKGLATPGSPRAGALVQGASFRGWKEVTSLFNKDDEQHLLESRKPPKSKGTAQPTTSHQAEESWQIGAETSRDYQALKKQLTW
ncbi:testis development-related protein isoform X3 [Lepus europaeus]|uniref:testis development-related protein isoform X3 n=1 Tax=Lepus europaeus TaxID=9983 RepID=UPI002B4A013F|nr:testis development-related protein isoform X3 [Lepus europaeus]